MKKRFLTLALALTLCAGLAVPAAAVADTRDPMIHYSDQTVQYGSYVVKEGRFTNVVIPFTQPNIWRNMIQRQLDVVSSLLCAIRRIYIRWRHSILLE